MNLKVLGSIAIVAGTAIGAGMLALPLANAALGSINALLLMLVFWIIAMYSALLMLEINLRSGVGDNVHVITGKTLGKVGQFIQGASFLALLFSLTAAYLGGGASLLTLKMKSIFDYDLNGNLAIILFALILGGLIIFGVAWIDKVSRYLFSLMIILLVVVVGFLFPEIRPSTLITDLVDQSSIKDWMLAVPVIFTSFGFHVCIATLVKYLDGDTKDLRSVLIIGSTIPLVCYILWLLVTMGTIDNATLKTFSDSKDSLALMIDALQNIVHSSIIKQCISLFADLALITSFLGVTLSLFDFIAELTRAKPSVLGKIQTWLLTFIPPLVWVLYSPKGFGAILGFAAVPLTIMIIFLPIAMAMQQRRQNLGGYQVLGGTPALAILGILGGIIVVSQIMVA